MFVHFGAFLAISLLIAVTPGPDTALVTRNALIGGRRAGLFTVLGIATGLAVWTIAASAAAVESLEHRLVESSGSETILVRFRLESTRAVLRFVEGLAEERAGAVADGET